MSNVSNRVRNNEEIISGFQKEDKINNLTKQIFDHHNNVAMSYKNNTCNLKMMMIKDIVVLLIM